MPATDLFSKRQAKPEEGLRVYRYDVIPIAFRVKVIHIMDDAFDEIPDIYDDIVNTLCREYGVFRLPLDARLRKLDSQGQLHTYFLQVKDVSRALDVVELAASQIMSIGRGNSTLRSKTDDLISELNTRFVEHDLGYRFEGGQIVRIDSEVIHETVIRPCIALLKNREYAGADDEFRRGLGHYRKGNMKESISECHKAFESVMKTICHRRRWAVKIGAGARDLIAVCFKNQLVPSFWQEQFSSLRKVLESASAPARNKMAAHGQGMERVEVPRHLAAYVMNMTAAAILFLVEAEASGVGK